MANLQYSSMDHACPGANFGKGFALRGIQVESASGALAGRCVQLAIAPVKHSDFISPRPPKGARQ